MSRKPIKSINWAALIERIPESEKNVLATFRAKSDQYLRRMLANPEAPPKIDWAFYRKSVATPGLVDKFQKEYESLSIPYPADKYTADIDNEAKQMEQKIDAFCENADQQIKELQSKVDYIKGLIPFSEMTMEDYKDLYPDHAFNPDKPTMWPHESEDQEENKDEKSGH
ncbi:ATP synthase subunit d, mitochondrial [Hylaeus anthracinus]|uniref:ATP synthase subunit d, mitochondrial n=1 Tax=Hylaeus anthracinus TaxID=313031 RepID=UPI0023B9D6F9|nr:ATP synthase subunit d, mitochondrial [Hylaeus anthracinus]XP_054009068.1 ATP synthase subunit d, mitochondrial [Hylaeus anthracinus]XP_054009070.1 ATP synthase subunit d, mitochondrial [Hylaeus anthracinus]